MARTRSTGPSSSDPSPPTAPVVASLESPPAVLPPTQDPNEPHPAPIPSPSQDSGSDVNGHNPGTQPAHRSTSGIDTNHTVLHRSERSQPVDHKSPYHLNNGDHPGYLLVPTPLTGQENFLSWKRAASISIAAKNKTQFIDGTLPRPSLSDPNLSYWITCNNMVMSWILQSVSPDIAKSIMFQDKAVDMWNELHDRFNHGDGTRIFELQTSISNLKQGDSNVTSYFTRLKSIWDELREFQSFSPCVCGCTCGAMKKLQDCYNRDQTIQFLMGLNESYAQVRAQILLHNPIPPLSTVFSMIVQEERQRSLGTNPIIAATSSSRPPAPKAKKPRPMCSHCKKPGHWVDKCYFIHGFPPGYGDKKRSEEPSKAAINQNTSSSTGSAPPMTHDQVQELITLLS
ncbi:hypothetical protein CsatB_000184 [Cannabis sativa]